METNTVDDQVSRSSHLLGELLNEIQRNCPIYCALLTIVIAEEGHYYTGCLCFRPVHGEYFMMSELECITWKNNVDLRLESDATQGAIVSTPLTFHQWKHYIDVLCCDAQLVYFHMRLLPVDRPHHSICRGIFPGMEDPLPEEMEEGDFITLLKRQGRLLSSSISQSPTM